MLKGIKRLIRKSPLGPLVKRIYRLCFPPQLGKLQTQNAKYDQETSAVMWRVLRPDSCCIDVGAHGGSILREMTQISPLGTHFAFEPLPHLAAHLQNAFPGVRVYEAAVSDHTGTAQFVYVENAPVYSGLQQRIYDRPDPVLKPITVNVVQLDDVIPNEQSVAFIKLDIEGGEFHALLGAARTVHRCRPVIVFEAGPKSTGHYGVGPEEVYRFIAKQFGYHLSTMQRWLASQPPYSETEFCQNWHSGPDFYFIAYPIETLSGNVP
jgi:FkbM family methyltransferase